MYNSNDCINKTDEELVNLSLNDANWFFCLSQRYEKKLLRYITRISGFRHEDAEDVLQDILIKTYYNLNSFDPRLKFSSWIYRIAHNQTVSEIRKKSIRPIIFWEEDDLEKIEGSFNIIKELDNNITKQNINKVLNLLDEKYRDVLALRFLDSLEYTEIADILRKPVSTIGNLIARGKKIFKKEYEKIINNKIV